MRMRWVDKSTLWRTNLHIDPLVSRIVSIALSLLLWFIVMAIILQLSGLHFLDIWDANF